MADNKTGKITQIIGAVLDIKFPVGSLPEINDAMFERHFLREGRRQRAGRARKEVTNG